MIAASLAAALSLLLAEPPAAALGPTASVVRAIVEGDAAAPERATRLLVRAGPGSARVSVRPNDLWPRARCGEPRPPPPTRSPQ